MARRTTGPSPSNYLGVSLSYIDRFSAGESIYVGFSTGFTGTASATITTAVFSGYYISP